MSYLAFARKYRPKDFEEIIGQGHITTTLKNAVFHDKLAHAYLFSGPRGIGKTSTARILAKALNCKSGPTAHPCNKCLSCKEISEGRSLDVLEIDGASNRGIDEIRTLRENVKFAPTASRFKIYIIDEVHMLTQEAFNALLKTLEEPPAHVKFIFATTQPGKVLPTILSRCQRFDFHTISTSDLVAKLKQLAKEEKIEYEEEAFFAIAKSAEGSLRDAEVILDQMSSFCHGKIKLKDVIAVLGLIPQEVIFKIVEKLGSKNITENITYLDQLFKDGKDPAQLVNSLIEYFRYMMLAKCGNEKLVELAKEDKEKIKKESEGVSLEGILYHLAVLSNTHERIKRQGMGRLFLEMALVKLSEQNGILPAAELMEKVGQLEQKLRALSTSNTTTNTTKIEPDFTQSKSQEVKTANNEQPQEEKEKQHHLRDKKGSYEQEDDAREKKEEINQEEKPPLDESQVSLVSFEQICKSWPQVIETVKKKKISLGLYLAKGQPIALHKHTLEIGFLKENEFHRENLEHSNNLKIIEQNISDIFGKHIKLKLVSYQVLPENAPLVNKQQEETASLPEEIDEEADVADFIQSAIDTFNGRIVQQEE